MPAQDRSAPGPGADPRDAAAGSQPRALDPDPVDDPDGFDPDAFDAFEAAGWDVRAAPYDAFWAPITERAGDALLDAAGVGRGSRLLDVGSGTGRLSRLGAKRGSIVTGLDVAPGMVELASSLVPEVTFVAGSAEAIPFPDGSFDAVAASFVLLHVGRQAMALAEMRRVLVDGGRIGIAMWDDGEANALHWVLGEAVKRVGPTPPPGLPDGPPAFYPDDRFAGIVGDAGFRDVRIDHLRFSVAFPDADAMWSGILGAGVRFPPLVNAQPADIRAAIHAEFVALLERYAVPGGLEVPTSIQVTSASR